MALTQVLDQHRQAATSNISANMLSTAKSICTTLLGCHNAFEQCGFDPTNVTGYSKTLIHSNYDAELWLHLCSLDNPAPIHLVSRARSTCPSMTTRARSCERQASWSSPGRYPPNTPVGSDHGTQPSLTPDNPYPWCATDAQSGSPPCPPGLDTQESALTSEEADAWAVRGAINAGLGVFLYVKDLAAR